MPRNKSNRIQEEKPPKKGKGTQSETESPDNRYNHFLLEVEHLRCHPLLEFMKKQSNFGNLLRSMNWNPATNLIRVHLRDSKKTSHWAHYYPYVEKVIVDRTKTDPRAEAQAFNLECWTPEMPIPQAPMPVFHQTAQQAGDREAEDRDIHNQVSHYILQGLSLNEIYQRFEMDENEEGRVYILDHNDELTQRVQNHTRLLTSVSSKPIVKNPIMNIPLSQSQITQPKNVSTERNLFRNPSTRELAPHRSHQIPTQHDAFHDVYDSISKVMSQSTDPRTIEMLTTTRNFLQGEISLGGSQQKPPRNATQDPNLWKPAQFILLEDDPIVTDRLRESQLKDSGKKKKVEGHETQIKEGKGGRNRTQQGEKRRKKKEEKEEKKEEEEEEEEEKKDQEEEGEEDEDEDQNIHPRDLHHNLRPIARQFYRS